MRLAVVGTGYVGLINAVCFAGHKSVDHVTCIDTDNAKVESLRKAEIPIYEPGLAELFAKHYDKLSFSTLFEEISQADIVFICVPTPCLPDGKANLSYLKSATEMCKPFLKEDVVFVIKSTVPPGTASFVKSLLPGYTVANNPEFLREGCAVKDFFETDRVIIGASSDEKSIEPLVDLYMELDQKKITPVLIVSNETAELIKYASNAFLACKISFINEIALLSEKVGADIEHVRQGMASDSRIGSQFLNPGPGYGGSCFPKDVKALIQIGNSAGIEMLMPTSTDIVNERQKNVLWQKICNHYSDSSPPTGKVFAFWGVSFKHNTDDVRESVALFLAKKILDSGNFVHFYDSVAANNFKKEVSRADNFSSPLNAVNGADALLILVDSPEFTQVDLEKVKERMNTPLIFDGRNILKKDKVIESGFTYYGIGK